MATNFPTSLDSFTNPTATDTLDSPPHDTQHADANDAIEALQSKVGVDSSAVTTSLDYRVGQLELGGGSMTTSSTAPSSPSDGDMWYDTDDGRTYVYYDDGTSAQWVEFGAPAVQHGKILQVVSTTKTDTFTTSSTSYTDVTGLSVSITPSSTSSKIYVVAHVPFAGVTSQVQRQGWSVFRDTTNLVNPDSPSNRTPAAHWQNDYQNQNTNMRATSFHFLDSPSSTSALTYKVRAVVESGTTAYINRSQSDADVSSVSRGVATITVMEVSA